MSDKVNKVEIARATLRDALRAAQVSPETAEAVLAAAESFAKAKANAMLATFVEARSSSQSLGPN